MNIKKIDDYIYEIEKEGQMLVPGRIYSSKKLLEKVKEDNSLKQVKNVATLPGIQKYSIAMPDIHEGYGFPIGGVAAVDTKEGYISPGGVGYDINCGVRLLKTNLLYEDISDKIRELLAYLYSNIPTGVGSKNAIEKLSEKEFRNVLKKGAKWAIEKGYGDEEDLYFTENNGCIKINDFKGISSRAIERGKIQLGTLGSGNHFLEIDYIDEIYNYEFAEIIGLEKGQIVILFHTGSRGFGHQVCDDSIILMRHSRNKFSYNPPDNQLISAPFYSDEGQKYFNAMNAAANFAWANRQIIKGIIEYCFIKFLKISKKSLGLQQIYDVCHNIAKLEYYNEKELLVHRKGATRAFGPGNYEIPEKFREIGQPVIIPGDMGTNSYLLVGTKKAEKETFGSTCHGAGRILSRKKALKMYKKENIFEKMSKHGIFLMAKDKRTVAEEVPEAYKNIDEVIKVVVEVGIAKKVARFKPIAVMKG